MNEERIRVVVDTNQQAIHTIAFYISSHLLTEVAFSYNCKFNTFYELNGA